MKHQFSFFKKTFVVRFFLDARQTHEFAVRFSYTHGKPMSLSCATFYAHGKIFFYIEVVSLGLKSNAPQIFFLPLNLFQLYA
jgi:hypothetical protein